ncbi:class I SAM-dependent methyltransferase [bacterium]|nr:class I SAM-dependent methyltransferase [bacterium]
MTYFLSLCEYIFLRLVRRFFFTDNVLVKVGKLLPYYRVNRGQSNFKKLVDDYERHLKSVNSSLQNKSVLEIGIGSTNANGYEIIARNAAFYYGLEPYRSLDILQNQHALTLLQNEHPDKTLLFENCTSRITSFKEIKPNSIDIVLSSSVLEHVENNKLLFENIKKCLKPDGIMIHQVDYRDHFFKYPYHFLIFSKKIWNTFLNPGDLYRYRLDDHIKILDELEFKTKILSKQSLENDFIKIKKHINPLFQGYSEESLKTSEAVLCSHC